MKKFYITLLSSLLFVTNYATDLVVNSSGQPGTYTTLSAALSAAASSGDRILIPSTITLIEDITINKSIDIMPQTEGNYFYLEGDINVTANAGLEIRILGMNFSGDLNCSSGTAIETNRCDLYFIDCNITDPGVTELDANVQGLGFHVLYCNIPDCRVYFRFGEIIASKLNGFFVEYGEGVNIGDTIKIIANIIANVNGGADYDDVSFLWSRYIHLYRSVCVYDNSDHYYLIANNLIKSTSSTSTLLNIFATDTISPGKNKIINNTFVRESFGGTSNYLTYGIINLNDIYDCSGNYPASSTSNYSTTNVFWTTPNTEILNNIFHSESASTGAYTYIHVGRLSNKYQSYYSETCSACKPFIKYNIFGQGTWSSSNWNTDLDISPLGSSIQNYFEYEIDPFNYAVQSTIYTSSNTNYSGDDGKALSGAVIDGGKNEASSYDIDMTRNDLGTYGGPYSMENYWDSTATGKARIYHLNMPSEIWSGQTPTIKASAVHKK